MILSLDEVIQAKVIVEGFKREYELKGNSKFLHLSQISILDIKADLPCDRNPTHDPNNPASRPNPLHAYAPPSVYGHTTSRVDASAVLCVVPG